MSLTLSDICHYSTQKSMEDQRHWLPASSCLGKGPLLHCTRSHGTQKTSNTVSCYWWQAPRTFVHANQFLQVSVSRNSSSEAWNFACGHHTFNDQGLSVCSRRGCETYH